MAASARAGWAWYKQCLSKNPLLTKSCTSALLMSGADVLSQEVETSMAQEIVDEKGPDVNLQDGCPTNVNAANIDRNQKQLSYDWLRSAHVGFTGFTLSGPISHAWYTTLERIVTVRHRFLGIAVRMVLDAVVFSPVAVAGYFTWRAALEGKGLQGILSKLQTKWESALVASWQFWPLANTVNFGLVPVQFRVLYNNVLSLFWNGYLSHLNGKRLEQIADDRINKPALFVPKEKGCLSDAERRANDTICVCSHCRPVRA